MRRTVSQQRLQTAVLPVALVVLATSCASGASAARPRVPHRLVPVVVSTDLAVGRNRLLLGRVDSTSGEPAVRAPSQDTDVALYDLAVAEGDPVAVVRARFFWAVPDRYGMFRADVTFTEAGPWAAELRPRGAQTTESRPRVEFEVRDESLTLEIGSTAPRSKTRTLADVGGDIARLTSDPHPDPRFYQTSIAGAMGMGVPFVVIFTSPAHCLTDLCLPALQRVKEVVADVTSLTVIHVEDYLDLDSPTPDVLDPVLGRWGLTSDTWVFAVTALGIVQAKFEASFEPGELFHEIQRLYGG